jgi:hypothetical protein
MQLAPEREFQSYNRVRLAWRRWFSSFKVAPYEASISQEIFATSQSGAELWWPYVGTNTGIVQKYRQYMV